MNKQLRKKLENLLYLIKYYEQQIKKAEQHQKISKQHQKKFAAAKVLYTQTKVILKENQITDNCRFDVKMLAPIATFTSLSNCPVTLQVTAKEVCNWQQKPLSLEFGVVSKDGLMTTTRVATCEPKDIVYTGDDKQGTASFFVQFEGDETAVKLIYYRSQSMIAIQYSASTNIDWSSANKISYTILSKKPLLNYPTEFITEMQQVFGPDINQGLSQWYDTFSPSSILSSLESMSSLTANNNFSEFSSEELQALRETCRRKTNELKTIDKKIRNQLQSYIELESMYDQSDKALWFDGPYHITISETKELLAPIANRIATIQIYENEVLTYERSLRPENKIAQKLVQWKDKVEPLLERLSHYAESVRSIEEWKVELVAAEQAIKALQQDFDDTWKPIVASGLGLINERDYKNLENVVKGLAENYYYVAKKEALVLVGDGFLEYEDGEDNYTTAEATKFNLGTEKEPIKTELEFTDTELPLYDKADGIDLMDIQQGAVGDCYLLAAIANFVGDDKKLIQDLIEEKDDKYIVTLHVSNIPVKVEVDKKMMYRSGDYNGILKGGYIAAKPLNDIWVPILEKAYAKLMAKGDYASTAINGGQTEAALKTLLGNKVQIPSTIYLDDKSAIVDERTANRFYNPIKMEKISVIQLQKLLLDAVQKGYKLNANSPAKSKGGEPMNDERILDMGEGKYMVFKHGYTITEVTTTTVEIFNPHGKSKKKDEKIFYEELKKLFKELLQHKVQLEKDEQLTATTRPLIQAALDSLKANADTSTPISGVIAAWQQLIAIADKATFTAFVQAITDIEKLDIVQGVVIRSLTVSNPQIISHKMLHDNFDSILLTLIKK